MNFVDTHAHLDFTDDVEGWIKRAKENGVDKIICVGTSVEASGKCAEIAEKYSKTAKRHSRESGNPGNKKASFSQARNRFRIKSGMTEKNDTQIWATVGIHAQDGKGDIDKYGSLDKCINELRTTARSSSKVVGVGECGLDYFLEARGQKLETSENERKFQRKLFEVQVGLAAELRLPLIVHCRNAWVEIFDLLAINDKHSTINGLFHSWTGDWEAAQKALALGLYISFSGIVTFKNAPKVQEVAKRVPIDRMLLETDSPFLSPEPLRSQRGPTSSSQTRLRGVNKQNEPKNVKIIAEFIARLRDLPVDRLADVTSKNAKRLFSI